MEKMHEIFEDRIENVRNQIHKGNDKEKKEKIHESRMDQVLTENQHLFEDDVMYQKGRVRISAQESDDFFERLPGNTLRYVGEENEGQYTIEIHLYGI
ncbi:MAG: hypothetical protein Q8R88_17670 [Desulfoprunum sp.]|nr:hypothetical protein [Desulfoprunum sp.]